MHLILLIHLHYTAWLFVHNLCTKSAVAVLVVELCDSIFRSLPNFNQPKVQCIHNSFAWLVTNHNKYMKATPILNSFHWLPVRHCCMFNMAMAVCEFLRSGHPSYFSPFLLPYSIYYNTRWGETSQKDPGGSSGLSILAQSYKAVWSLFCLWCSYYLAWFAW